MALRAPWGQMQGSATTAMRWHRRGAMTTQMAPRRRNPKGGRHFAGARLKNETSRNDPQRAPDAKCRTRHPHPFFSSLLEPGGPAPRTNPCAHAEVLEGPAAPAAPRVAGLRLAARQPRGLDGPLLPDPLPDHRPRVLGRERRLRPLPLRPGFDRRGALRRTAGRPMGRGAPDAGLALPLRRDAAGLSLRPLSPGDRSGDDRPGDPDRGVPPGRDGLHRRDRGTGQPQVGVRGLPAGDQPRDGDRPGDRRHPGDAVLPLPLLRRRRDVDRGRPGARGGGAAGAAARERRGRRERRRRRPACGFPRRRTWTPDFCSSWRPSCR